jgi:hypothetical protein
LLHTLVKLGATITMVAEAAKVSNTKVSRVLSGKRPVTQAGNGLRIMEGPASNQTTSCRR